MIITDYNIDFFEFGLLVGISFLGIGIAVPFAMKLYLEYNSKIVVMVLLFFFFVT